MSTSHHTHTTVAPPYYLSRPAAWWVAALGRVGGRCHIPVVTTVSLDERARRPLHSREQESA